MESSANSAAVFSRHGLGSPGLWGDARIPHEESGTDGIARRLREALEQLGGLYAAFGGFLRWRADLLGATYVGNLRQLSLKPPVVPPGVVAATVLRELGRAGVELAANIAQEPAWNTVSRTAYESTWRGQRVIVQVARDGVTDESFAEFEKGLRALGRPEVSAAVNPAIISQFHHWLRNSDSLDRERSFLNVLAQHRGETLAEYPLLIPELSSPSVLCWPVVEGRPVAELLSHGDADVSVLIASAVLEQFYSLSIVDADLDLDAMVVGTDNRLHYRRLSNPLSVLPGQINTGIKYMASVVAGNASISAQTLIRLVLSHPPLNLEKELMDEFSGIEPDLKVNMWFPPSAEAFENNWRALSKLIGDRPLFLDCLHRNLVAVGYWNSDAVRGGAPPLDAISEAQWPVVGRLLRTQFGMLMNRDSATEWAFGSGLLLFSAVREMNRLAEEMRENDITIGVEVDHPRELRSGGQSNRSYGVILTGLLVFLLVSLRWGGEAPEPWSMVLKVLAVGSLPAMFWAISRIG